MVGGMALREVAIDGAVGGELRDLEADGKGYWRGNFET